MPTRREFIIGCTALAVTSSVKPALALGTPFRPRDLRLEEISFRDFLLNVNTPFLVSQGSRTLTAVQLVEAKLGERALIGTNLAEDAPNEKFSLLFAGNERAELQSGTYDFEHEGIGRFQMFITPIGPAPSYYQAVFNRPAQDRNRTGLADIREFRR
jgi:hypothetical protein